MALRITSIWRYPGKSCRGEELAAGRDTAGALAVTLGTAGRTVLFSAATVAVSLAAMLVFPLYFLRSLAYAGISVVVLAAAWAQDCHHVLLQSGRQDPRVHRFYASCGFTSGLRVGYVAQRPAD